MSEPEQMKNNSLKGVVLPPQPGIIAEIRRFKDDLDKVSELIITDPSLASGILRTVNSPAFGLPEVMASTKDAINLLGIEKTLNIVNAVMIQGSIDYLSGADLTTFWMSSSDVAKACAAISRYLDLGIEDIAYAAGLFHNCGLPVMASKFDDYWETIVSSYHNVNETNSIISQENDRYSTNHAVVGYFIAKAWHLPKEIADSIRFHHNPHFHKEVDEQVETLLCILKMSEHIVGVYHVVGGQMTDREWGSFKSQALEHFGLSEYDYEEMASIIKEKVEGLL